ncbi:MAG TPA: alpha/beta hydrolase [Candidatus Binatia bacterium]|nr:alpha/beta hydrolase [Candidatus Binatia bacterium]
MARASSNGIEIEYETFGAVGAEPLLLIMGLGAQMILWPDDFCHALAGAGHRVIRFDNRDAGASTHLDDARMPDIGMAMAAAFAGLPVDAPYTLSDMAADAAGLLTALDIESAHVVGASMGGMIAQTMAIEHPGRVRTLTSIMSTTGDPTLPQATAEAMGVLLTAPPPDREGAIAHATSVFRIIGSPGYPFDEEWVRATATRSYDRGFDPLGTGRQLAAILASGNRTGKLRDVRIPSLVIHGKDDPLVRLEAGMATASAIAGARLVVLEGMGHDLPRQLWSRYVEEITALTGARAPSARA